MPKYTAITIIYNPNSTGNSEALAKETVAELHTALPGQTISLQPTKHAGHAETLAYDLSRESKRPLIISASGDGGYHEVVNGIMRAQMDGAQATAGLLPAGNANDHHRNVHETNFVEAIEHGNEQIIDLLTCTGTVKGEVYSRYAHSYIGVGLTPKAGRELNKTQLNRIVEKWIALKAVVQLKPVQLIVNGKLRSYNSLTFSNIADMSKVLSLSDIASYTDGKFEITQLSGSGTLRLVRSLLRAITVGLRSRKQASNFSFDTTEPTLIQLDGEIQTIDANTTVSIGIAQQSLRCIV